MSSPDLPGPKTELSHFAAFGFFLVVMRMTPLAHRTINSCGSTIFEHFRFDIWIDIPNPDVLA